MNEPGSNACPGANHPDPERPSRRAARTGEVWRARADDDRCWRVIVIGRLRNTPSWIRVVPIALGGGLATERDLVLGPVWGEDAFADCQNLGTLLGEQLLERLGRLEHDQSLDLVALHSWTLTGVPAPPGVRTGTFLYDSADPRLTAAAERRQLLSGLWARTAGMVDS